MSAPKLKAPLPKPVATRIEEEDRLKLATIAHQRRLSVATVVRDAIAFYLAAGAPPPEIE